MMPRDFVRLHVAILGSFTHKRTCIRGLRKHFLELAGAEKCVILTCIFSDFASVDFALLCKGQFGNGRVKEWQVCYLVQYTCPCALDRGTIYLFVAD